MSSVCFYFQVHQPYRIKRFRIFDIGKDGDYFDDNSETNLNNAKVLKKVAEKSYLPANKVILNLLKKHPEFKVSYSLSGVLLDQLEEFSPETLESFVALSKTGQVEFLGETYHHSLSFLHSDDEFKDQVKLHSEKIEKLFGQKPTAFRNTELVYNNRLAEMAESLGFKTVLAEGADHILGWRSPNFIYRPAGTKKIKLLLKNYRLSDDIAFRFSSRDWSEWPLEAPKFASWVNAVNGNGELINLFMDYETFGEHQWADTGIFNFLESLPGEILSHPDNSFVTVSEAGEKYNPVGELDAPNFYSWADTERDLSAWLGNSMQNEAMQKIYSLRDEVLSSGDEKLINDWRRLLTSDHFYYMCTKWWNDGDVHKYFNPYESPYDAFISFMNVFNDLKLRISKK